MSQGKCEDKIAMLNRLYSCALPSPVLLCSTYSSECSFLH